MLKRAKEVIVAEQKALSDLIQSLDANFVKAVELMASCDGRIVISGMGKTGIIGRKIAATLSSTGTPSIFMHSAEAVHGDLGQLTKDDVLVIISYSGETEETVRLLPLVKKIGSKTISITGNAKSTLAKHVNISLVAAVKKEGCPLGLAPMASTTATLVLGDALAACLIDFKNFKKENFALYHPGGSLGRRLLMKVEDLMRKEGLFAVVNESATVKDVLLTITKMRCGSACVLNSKGKFTGIFTDGDLRRHIEDDEQILLKSVKDVMTHNPKTIQAEQLAVDALAILKDKRVDELPVVNKRGKLIGLLDVQDLLKAGLV